ncbi:DUF3179 domain-containing (seleno)protein [Ensifer sp. WSM1721]|uniref:DUF3179 domain-containing (seleno)protein n=1 Tax=Ensifer sp. WSM1721 TaxID=1041159 RepID=UPI0035232C68
MPGVPVTVTYCPLCNTGIVFDRRLAGRTLDFGTTGKASPFGSGDVRPPDGELVAAIWR